MTDAIVTRPEPTTEPATAERVFAEPWQAQAFALTMQLSQRGAFALGDWVEVFSTEIRAHPARPGEGSVEAYYRQWLAALETILTARGLSTTEEIAGVQERWRQAYASTPHGLPVVLENAGPDRGADDERDGDHGGHDHHHLVGLREPVAVSPAAGRPFEEGSGSAGA